MWLLDANMDVHLAFVLTGLEIKCDTAGTRGWKALSNGDLVKAVVVVNIQQRRWPQYRERFVARWAEHPIEPVAGRLIDWP
jgi:hypothetical protein